MPESGTTLFACAESVPARKLKQPVTPLRGGSSHPRGRLTNI